MRLPTQAAPALALAAVLTALAPAHAGTVSPAPRPVLGWIANDYTRALAEARARKLPIFIESWAPW